MPPHKGLSQISNRDWMTRWNRKHNRKNVEDGIPWVAKTTQELLKDTIPVETDPSKPEDVLECMEE